jgi:hypothetical protein
VKFKKGDRFRQRYREDNQIRIEGEVLAIEGNRLRYVCTRSVNSECKVGMIRTTIPGQLFKIVRLIPRKKSGAV